MKRFLALSALLLCCLAILTLLCRNILFEQLLGLTLTRLGATEVRCEISHSSVHGLDIGFLSAYLPDAGIRLHSNDIHVAWDRRLPEQRQLARITVAQLRLTLVSSGRKKGSATARFDSIDQLVRLLDRPVKLPVTSVQIHCLRLHTPAMAALENRCFSIDLQQEQAGQRLLITEKTSRMRADFYLAPRKWSWSFDSPGGEMPGSWFAGMISKGKNRLNFKANLNLARLEGPCRLLGRPVMPLAGDLRLTGFMTRESEPVLWLDAILARGRLRDTVAGKTHLQLKAHFAQGSFRLDQGSRLRINNLQNTIHHLSLASMDLPLAAKFVKNSTAWTVTFPPGKRMRLTAVAAGPNLSLQAASLTLPSRITASRGQISIQGADKAEYRCAGLNTSTIQVSQMTLVPQQSHALLAALPPAGSSWRISPGPWKLTVAGLRASGIHIAANPILIRFDNLRKTNDNILVKGTVSTSALHLTNAKNGLHLHRVHLNVDGHQGQLQCQGGLQLNNRAGELNLAIRHDLRSGRGDLQISTKPALSFSKKAPLSSLLDKWPLPVDLKGGTTTIQADATWPSPRLKTSIRIRDGSGLVRSLPFSGLNADLRLALLPRIMTLAPARITIAALSGPVGLHDLATTMRIKPGRGELPRIILENSHAKLLGGTLRNDAVSVDLNNPDVKTIIRVDHLDLASLLALQQVKGLAVNGSVSGTFPIHFNRNGLRIENARLHNLPPGGIIRYTPEDAASLQSSPLTGIALKALEEFHYKLLSANADYQPDGTLLVTMHLEGKSPKLDSSRPVHLNINTEQNLLSLLKSLRYSETLTNEIDRRIEKHFQPDPSQ